MATAADSKPPAYHYRYDAIVVNTWQMLSARATEQGLAAFALRRGPQTNDPRSILSHYGRPGSTNTSTVSLSAESSIGNTSGSFYVGESGAVLPWLASCYITRLG